MSGFTRCNLCTLHDMERRASERGATVSVTRDGPSWAVQYSDRDTPSAWLRLIPSECACES